MREILVGFAVVAVCVGLLLTGMASTAKALDEEERATYQAMFQKTIQ